MFDWKDQDEADDMGVNVRTLREWRRSLDEGGYITCNKEQYGQSIVIHNWINPRNYSGEVLNETQSDIIMEPQSDSQSTPQSYIPFVRKDVTPTSNSLINNQPSLSERKKEAEERKAKQRAAKGDIVDLFIQVSPALQEQTLMRQRVENALHRNLDWDSARSPWNGYEKKLVRREKDNSQTIEGFMEWFNSDEFRKKGVIYLNPTKIEDWWLQAFETTLSYDEQLAKAGYK